MLLASLLVAASLTACNGDVGSQSITPTEVPSATATGSPGPPEPQLDRMLEHIEYLSVEIGARVAGSPDEQRAVDYLSTQLESYGYNVDVESFPAQTGPSTGLLRYVTLTVDAPEEREIDAVSLLVTPSGVFAGTLVDAGDGSQFPAEADGAIALVQRGTVTFKDMAANGVAAGALAVVIVNKEPGLFPGIIDPPVALPVAGIDQADGEALRSLMDAGPVAVTLNVRPRVTAQNVIARPASGECRTLSGGHYDSVPWAPGANDNASGTAVVLELARAASVAGLEDHCFVLFGAEELGLIGSKTFVSDLTSAEQDALEVMYNFDVTAASDQPIDLIGPDELVTDALDVADGAGINARASRLPTGANSDHASFGKEGIPALMLTTTDLELIHTPRDTTQNIVDQALLDIARLGFALIRHG